jgi:hypothetical protein
MQASRTVNSLELLVNERTSGDGRREGLLIQASSDDWGGD